MKKVSVIVPVYNAEKYLDKCLSSLVDQTLEDIEIICINDGSTDSSLSILRKYEKKYRAIKVLDQEDLGQANACNRGLDTATGEYVCEVDSDDYVELNYLENMYALAKENKADVVKCGYYAFAEDYTKEYRWIREDKIMYLNPKELKLADQVVVFGKPAALWAGIYKRKFLLKNNLRYREGHNFEDTSLEFKIKATANKYIVTGVCYYHWRKDNENSGTNTIKDKEAVFEQYNEIKEWCMNNNPGLWEYQKAYAYYTFGWAYRRLTTTEDKIAFRTMEEEFYKNNLVTDTGLFNDADDYVQYFLISNGLWNQS